MRGAVELDEFGAVVVVEGVEWKGECVEKCVWFAGLGEDQMDVWTVVLGWCVKSLLISCGFDAEEEAKRLLGRCRCVRKREKMPLFERGC